MGKRKRSNLIRTLWLLATALFVGSSAALAQSGPQIVEEVRTIFPREFGVPHPAGLSYSSVGVGQYFMLGKNRADQPTAEGSTVVIISPFEDLVGAVSLEFVVDDTINTAFDDKGKRLFLLNSELAELARVEVNANGLLDPATLVRFDVSQFGLAQAQGMDVDGAGEHLFILDSATSEVVRLALNTGFGADGVAIAKIDLSSLGATDLRGLAIHPDSNNLYVVSPTAQKLYELTQLGQLVASYDLVNLDLADPGGLAFAPSADLTDDFDTMHLNIADSGLPDSQASNRIYLPLIINSGSNRLVFEEAETPKEIEVEQRSSRIIEVVIGQPSQPVNAVME